MRKSITFLLAITTLVLAGCASMQTPASTARQKSAIESVFAQRAQLKAKERRTGLLSKENVSDLMAIDVRNCPADFRSAWFDYLVQIENLHTRMARVAVIAKAEGKTVTDVPSLVKFAAQNAALGQYLLAALDKVDAARGKVDRVAMNYGVMPGQ